MNQWVIRVSDDDPVATLIILLSMNSLNVELAPVPLQSAARSNKAELCRLKMLLVRDCISH